ncbi:nucleoside triphosphate pyrophosphatase [Roseomonas sp. 18066]|uniref:Maf family protein n=1 Tax=Roseomonas sp. 18066 TaxID=2681412 RepID=UPI00135C956A|nr:Maf family protein [Roseomonas sp. 18066]
MTRLVLASSSTTRAALLRAAGLEFEARPAHVDEAALKEAAQAEEAPPAEAAILLAEAKAARIGRRDTESLVIGADQLLVCGKDWFDKPADLAAARHQLQALRGRSHTLYTAMVLWRGGQRVWHHVATPRLTMRGFSDAFLDRYLASEGQAVLSSVGAYRLEGLGVQLFQEIQGEHSAILGLPLLPLLGFLRQHGAIEE